MDVLKAAHNRTEEKLKTVEEATNKLLKKSTVLSQSLAEQEKRIKDKFQEDLRRSATESERRSDVQHDAIMKQMQLNNDLLMK